MGPASAEAPIVWRTKPREYLDLRNPYSTFQEPSVPGGKWLRVTAALLPGCGLRRPRLIC